MAYMFADLNRLLIVSLAALPFLAGSLRLIILRIQRDREWSAAHEIRHYERLTIAYHKNGDISLLRNRGPGLFYLILGAAIMIFSIPLSYQMIPKFIVPLNVLLSEDVVTGIVAGFPLWVMLIGLALLTFAEEWFMTEDTIISNHTGMVKTQSFWTRWTRSWSITNFHALHHATDGRQSAIFLKFRESPEKRPLTIGLIPYSESAEAISLIKSALNLPTTSENKKNLEVGNSPWA
jgi:hypothetical protein